MSDSDSLDHLARLGLAPPAEPAGGLSSFEPGGAYQCHARPLPALQTAIHFIFRNRAILSCQYGDLDSLSEFRHSEDGGHVLQFRFRASLISDAILEGRNLWQLYDYITRHRMPWVHELPAERDFEAREAVVINRITLRPAGV